MSKKQSKKKLDFKLNDLVFARVKGYAPWPAKIVETGPKFKVTFFGTGEIGMIKVEDLFNYEQNREAFKNKYGKRKNYQESLNEITRSWNNKKACEAPAADQITVSRSDETTTANVAKPVIIDCKVKLEQIVPEPRKQEVIPQEVAGPTEKTSKPKRSLAKVDSSPPAKRIKTESPESSQRKQPRDTYFEDSELKIKVNDELFTAYTAAGLRKLKSRHEELLSKNLQNVTENDCCFLHDKSIVLIYEPSIHPVVFGIFITRHRPKEFETLEAQLRWEIKVVKDVHHAVADLKKKKKTIAEVMDDYFLSLGDFEQLMSHIKIILEREDLPEFKKETITKELCILKITMALRENVPVDIKDENCLVRALELLKLVRDKYDIPFMLAMKHPVIVESFSSLSRYKVMKELKNKLVVRQIQEEAQLILDTIKDKVKYLGEEDFKDEFWKPYLRCVKRFQQALIVNRFDFMAITSLEEYDLLLEKQRESANQD